MERVLLLRTTIAVPLLRSTIWINLYLTPLIAIGFCLLPSEGIAAAHSGIDTMVVDQGFDFTEARHEIRYYSTESDDFSLLQLQNWNAGYAHEGGLSAPKGIRDMGAIPFEGVVAIPDTLGPDPAAEVRDPITGELYGWHSLVKEGHTYIIWTHEGNVAKVFIKDIVTIPEWFGDATLESLWGDFIVTVIFHWAYQDDGSRSFPLATAVSDASWGDLKSGWK